MTAPSSFGRQILDQWLLDPDLAFLNHGSFGATPRVVIEHQRNLIEEMERNPVRFMDVVLPAGLRDSASVVSDWLGIDPEGTAFVANATDGINAVLRSLELSPGDRVVTTNWVYGAIEQTLRFVCERAGAVLDIVHLPFPCSSADELAQTICARLEGARFLVLDEIASKPAVRLPVERILREAKRCGVETLVDGAHVPGQTPLCFQDELRPDYWVGNLHKWSFAPKGCAILWVAEPHRDQVHPTIISHGYRSGFAHEFDWVGTRDPTAWLTAPAGLTFIDRWGREAVWDYQTTLRREASSFLRELWDVPKTAPDDVLCAMESFQVPFECEGTDEAADALNARLRDEYGVEVPVFALEGVAWIRISAQIYVDMRDIERLGHAVRSMIE